MRKKFCIAAVLIAALLVIVGCSGTPGSAENALPDWLADKTWEGSITMSASGTYPDAGTSQSMPMTIKTGANDFYFTGEGSMNQSGMKAQLDAQGVPYRENKSNTSYSIVANGMTINEEVPGVGSMAMTADITITFTKISETTMKFVMEESVTGSFLDQPINGSMTMSGDFTRL